MRRYVLAGMALRLAASALPALAQKTGRPRDPLHPRMVPSRDQSVRTVHSSRTDVGVRNTLGTGATNAQIYRDGRLLATKSAGPNHHATTSDGHTTSRVTSGRPVTCGPMGVYKDGKLLISKRRC